MILEGGEDVRHDGLTLVDDSRYLIAVAGVKDQDKCSRIGVMTASVLKPAHPGPGL